MLNYLQSLFIFKYQLLILSGDLKKNPNGIHLNLNEIPNEGAINLCRIDNVKSGVTKSSSIMTNIRINFSLLRICFKKLIFILICWNFL